MVKPFNLSTTDRMLVFTIGGATVLGMLAVFLPREALPSEAPALRLSRLSAMQCTSIQAPKAALTKLEIEINKLYLDQGRAEFQGSFNRFEGDKRAAERKRSLNALKPTERKTALARLSAYVMSRYHEWMNASTLPAPEPDLQAYLGSFPSILERYHVFVDGIRTAPLLVDQTLFHARWNAIHELPLDANFCAEEQVAYDAWLGLQGRSMSIARRFEALKRVPGTQLDTIETQFVALLEQQETPYAIKLLEQQPGLSPRHKNFLKGARAIAKTPGAR